jgi:hypothetical protein
MGKLLSGSAVNMRTWDDARARIPAQAANQAGLVEKTIDLPKVARFVGATGNIALAG